VPVDAGKKPQVPCLKINTDLGLTAKRLVNARFPLLLPARKWGKQSL